MTRDDPDRNQSGAPEHDPEEALKKPPARPKGGKDGREARLAKALRDNLRRRKAAGRQGAGRKEKETD
jgi:hypothetical protein